MGFHIGCPSGSKTGEHGFCKSCSGQQAMPLCLNYANSSVRCEGSIQDGADRNEVFCKTCQSAVKVPHKKQRLCKNAAAGDNRCSNDSSPWLQNAYYGMCSSCAQTQKALLADAAGDPTLCHTAGCLHPFELPLSRFCRHCILEKKDLQIDVREKALVLQMEAEAATGKRPALQKMSETGDPFHLYLPRAHAALPAYSSQAVYLPWNHCPM